MIPYKIWTCEVVFPGDALLPKELSTRLRRGVTQGLAACPVPVLTSNFWFDTGEPSDSREAYRNLLAVKSVDYPRELNVPVPPPIADTPTSVSPYSSPGYEGWTLVTAHTPPTMTLSRDRVKCIVDELIAVLEMKTLDTVTVSYSDGRLKVEPNLRPVSIKL